MRTAYLHWLEDECFFSLCSRQHLLCANHSSAETLSYLFGSETTSFSHDFPRSLELLNEDAKLTWGSSEEIIRKHTISPIFFPFQSPEHVGALEQAMNRPTLGSFKYRLGLVTGRFGGEHPLKACTQCMTADRALHGVAYWHLSHQFPGVSICPLHNCLLMESTENRQWSRRFQWVLPDEAALITIGSRTPSASTLKTLQAMSIAVVALGKWGSSCRFEPSMVVQVYKAAINLQGISPHAREATAERFAEYCSILQPYPPFSALPCDAYCAIRFMTQMTRKPRSYCHPLKHLTLIMFLFGRFDLFVGSYQQLAAQQEISVSRNAKLISQIQPNECPLPKLELEACIPKPKKLIKELKDKIIKSLMVGTSKKEICSRFELSISTVNRVLRFNPLVEKEFNKIIYLRKQEQQRNRWDTSVSLNPNLSTNDIKKLNPNVYAWLYRNDRSWLSNRTSNLPSGRRGNHVCMDWDSRDEKLRTLIKLTLIEHPTKLRKSDLYLMVPSLFSSLEKRSHYPKTRKFLSEMRQSFT
ncbi:TnsD family Tn7-like transposition protein [Pseudomonas sp. ADAK13]|uniref:TnsD family Tn7-like transposition protein n=1 Tax=Pseudomonas sp. ADAK13 TaxID=2730847 RepID=UPI00146423AA|nr:TnsD family Tn7-like transposition protein [Pseudomonas sp. ADAK13]QJI34851.1 hypothetical protein HKK54_10635 [Pseudomonas sp. ADAK13]